MNAQVLHKFEAMAHAIALWTSIAATMLLASVFFFSTNIDFGYHLQRFISGKPESTGLPIFLGMLLAIFFGYMLASKKQLAEVGGTITVVAVAAIYGWCAFVLSYSPGPFLMALAGPALFHLASSASQRAAAKQAALAPAEGSQLAEYHDEHHEPAEVVHEEREPVAGAA